MPRGFVFPTTNPSARCWPCREDFTRRIAGRPADFGLDAAHELFAAEELDRPVELAREPRGGVLSQLPHPLVEGERCGLDVTVELA